MAPIALEEEAHGLDVEGDLMRYMEDVMLHTEDDVLDVEDDIEDVLLRKAMC